MTKRSIAYRLALIVFLSWIATSTRAQPQNGQLRIAVERFVEPTHNPFWWRDGAKALQRGFVRQLRKSPRFQAIRAEKVGGERGQKASGDDYYILSGSVTEYGITDGAMTAAVEVSIFDVSTGDVVFREEANQVFSAGSAIRSIQNPAELLDKARNPLDLVEEGSTSKSLFSKVMKPIVMDLTASIKAADL